MKYVKLIAFVILVHIVVSCDVQNSGPGTDHLDSIDAVDALASLESAAYDLIPCASDFEGTLRHLMYKTGVLSNWYANTELHGYECFLNGNNPGNWKEKEKEHIFIVEYWRPRADEIRNIVFLTAGQQGNLIDRMAPENIVTGQYKDYHAYDGAPVLGINTWKYMKNAPKKIKWKSIAGQIIADGVYNQGKYFGFTPGNTYLALAFDSCNYWELTAPQKNNLAVDFIEWLFLKAGGNTRDRIETIYMAGSSMGGALCATMAYKMKHTAEWALRAKSAKIIVSLLDAVANQEIGEVWTTPATIKNPLNSAFYCFVSRLCDYFTPLDNTWIFQIAGGADVVPVIGAKYHSFYFQEKPEQLKFKWVNRDHFGIGRDWNDDTSRAELVWLAQTLRR